VLSGRALCDGLITRPEESYRLRRVVMCDLETSKMRRLKPATGLWKIQPKGCNARKTTSINNVADVRSCGTEGTLALFVHLPLGPEMTCCKKLGEI
jgi:hypothetical protein